MRHTPHLSGEFGPHLVLHLVRFMPCIWCAPFCLMCALHLVCTMSCIWCTPHPAVGAAYVHQSCCWSALCPAVDPQYALQLLHLYVLHFVDLMHCILSTLCHAFGPVPCPASGPHHALLLAHFVPCIGPVQLLSGIWSTHVLLMVRLMP